ncbi:MAG: hypothetical protein NT040_15370 [Bacteroidetes bacterium]|nr:hypothetical protein [Bacteroidota bacterium]
MQGNLITTLVDEDKTPGKYTDVIGWVNAPGGEYFYQAAIGDKKVTKQNIHINQIIPPSR